MTQPDPRRYLLSETLSQRIFQLQIIAAELAHGVPQQRPVVVFVAGQPGAGKTKTTEAIKTQLDARGGAIVVNSDYYKPFHPAYAQLLREDDRNAAAYTSMDGRRWMAAAQRYLIDRRVDTIIETTMRDPGDFLEPAQMFRDAGYRVEAAIMAVPEPPPSPTSSPTSRRPWEPNGTGTWPTSSASPPSWPTPTARPRPRPPRSPRARCKHWPAQPAR